MSDCQGVEASGAVVLAQKGHQEDQGPEDDGKRSNTQGGRRDTETRRDPRRVNPQGPTGTWVQVESGNGGGGRSRTWRKAQACCAGRRASGGGWRGVGVGDVYVDGVPCQERRWGAGVNERCGNDDHY